MSRVIEHWKGQNGLHLSNDKNLQMYHRAIASKTYIEIKQFIMVKTFQIILKILPGYSLRLTRSVYICIIETNTKSGNVIVLHSVQQLSVFPYFAFVKFRNWR